MTALFIPTSNLENTLNLTKENEEHMQMKKLKRDCQQYFMYFMNLLYKIIRILKTINQPYELKVMKQCGFALFKSII